MKERKEKARGKRACAYRLPVSGRKVSRAARARRKTAREALSYPLLFALCAALLAAAVSCAKPGGTSGEDFSKSALSPTSERAETESGLISPPSPHSEEPSEDPSDERSSSPVEEGPVFSCREKGDGGVVAVWWWNGARALAPNLREKYLDFLCENDVNEIYLCLPDFKKEKLAAFVASARKREISVWLLSGDPGFIDPGNAAAEKVIDDYLSYQQSVGENERLAGLHLDVEPHARPDFGENRQKLLDLYAGYVVKTAAALRGAGERVAWDIPFWFEGFSVQTPEGKRPILEVLAQNSDLLCLMSYRNTAKAVLALSEEEIALCRRSGVGIVCGVAAGRSDEGDDVSFYLDGKEIMYRETALVYNDLRSIFSKEGVPYGVAFHDLDAWYALKD